MKRFGYGERLGTTLTSVTASTRTYINLYEGTRHLQIVSRPTPEDTAGASNRFLPVLPALGCHVLGNASTAVYTPLAAGNKSSDNQRLACIHSFRIRVRPE